MKTSQFIITAREKCSLILSFYKDIFESNEAEICNILLRNPRLILCLTFANIT